MGDPDTQDHPERLVEPGCWRRGLATRPPRRGPNRTHHAGRAAELAGENQRLWAELQTSLLEVEASRARIVEAGDRERRRIERNLHDGAQQRLVALALTLRLASSTAADDPSVAALLVEAAADVDAALHELRDLSRGLHPAIVTDAGLGASLETLAERPGIPVQLTIELPGRIAQAAAVGAYYVVAEALANANRHSAATQVAVRAHVLRGVLRVSVCDDGSGGAAVAPGSGLEGLADRVNALGGRLAVHSPCGGGTTVTADIPVQH